LITNVPLEDGKKDSAMALSRASHISFISFLWYIPWLTSHYRSISLQKLHL